MNTQQAITERKIQTGKSPAKPSIHGPIVTSGKDRMQHFAKATGR